jgi:NADH-quinone oxidoreductase subunit N
VIAVLAVLTLFTGSVLAVVQTNVKRMLAYSSIAHVGFILVGVELASPAGTSAVLFYLAVYTFLVAGSFAVVTLVDRAGDGHHAISDYRGLARSSPLLAVTLTLLLLAQAGVPFTSGFLAKFNVISAAADEEVYWLAVVAMVSAVIAAYLYLRIVITMWSPGDADDEAAAEASEPTPVPVPWGVRIALVACSLVTIGVGIYPEPLLDWTDESTPELVRPEEPPDPAAAEDPTAGLPPGVVPGAPVGTP